jgi:hypothetical protein
MLTLMNKKKASAMIAPLLLLPALLLSFLHTGCEKEEPDPAKRLFVKAIREIGGMKKATGWETRVEKGILVSVTPGWGNLKAECAHFVKKPDKLKIDNDFSAYDHPFYWIYYLNGESAWGVANLGVRVHPRITENLTSYMEAVDGLAYYLTTCDTFFLVDEVPDDSLFAGADIARAGIVDEGDTILFDFSTQSHLLVRRIDEGGMQHTILDDYRKTNVLKMPFKVTVYTNGAISREYTWNEITFNTALNDAMFEEDRPAPPEEEPPADEGEEEEGEE